ncbi:adenylate kinase [Dinochytrium kinnereticum]|nr:adenylate kinase [Dinochytrium kinnereticum]
MGKPGSGKTTLARRIAAAMSVELVCPEHVVERVVASGDGDGDFEGDGDEGNNEEEGVSGEVEGEQQSVKHVERTIEEEVRSMLKAGKQVTNEIMMKLLEEAANSEDSQYKGYVLDGLPHPGPHQKTTPPKPSTATGGRVKTPFSREGAAQKSTAPLISPDLRLMKDIVEIHQTGFKPILINLNIEEGDLIQRRESQWLDPVTGTLYPGAQISYTKKRRAEGWVDGMLDSEGLKSEDEEEESWSFDYNLDDENEREGDYGRENDDDNEKDIDAAEDEDRSDDAIDVNGDGAATGRSGSARRAARRLKRKLAGEPKKIRLENKVAWPLIGKEILERLIKRPEDTYDELVKQMNDYASIEHDLTELTLQLFDHMAIIQIDATQHPDLIVRNVMERLQSMGVPTFLNPVIPKKLEVPDRGFRGVPEADVINYLSTYDLEEVKRCKAGRSIPPELMIEVLKQALQEEKTKNGENATKGWVLDGFPRTLDQASAMIAAEITPQYVMVLTNDINDDAVRVRLKSHQANSRTGLAWSEATKNQKPSSPPQISLPNTPGMASNMGSYACTTPLYANKPSSGGLKSIQPSPPTTAPPNATVSSARSRPISGSKILGSRLSFTSGPQQDPLPPLQQQNLEAKEVRSPYAMPPIAISMYPFFDNLYNGFREEFQTILKLLQDNSSLILQIGAEQGIPTVLSMIQTAVDPFLPKARSLNAKQIAELPEKIELGFTKDFCPFALRQANILQKGDTSIAVKYETTIIKSLTPWNVPTLTFKQLVNEFSKVVDPDERDEIDYMMRENAGLLSPLIVQDMITYLFQKEPYASKGFLLEGFPRTKVEAEVLIKHNLFVDAFVNLTVEPDLAAKRIFRDIHSAVIAAKNRLKEAEAIYGIESLEYATALNEKEEEEKKIAKSEDELMEELTDLAEKENMRVSEVISSVDGNWSVPIIELDGTKCIRPVVASLRQKLKPIFEARGSIFSNAIRVEKADAETLLRLGIKSYSAFGQYCPVAMAKSASVLQRQIGTKPIVYGDHIYFVKGEAQVKDFLENTLGYISLPPPKPVVRPRVCILGRPKSGKSTLAAKACAELELIHLTIPSVLDSLLARGDNCNLSLKIKSLLSEGKALPDDLINEALLKVTARGVCQAKGWILDGYPQTLSQAEYLEKRGFIPHLIVQLDLLDSSMIKRTLEDFKEDAKNLRPDLNFEPVVRDRDENYRAEIQALNSFYDKRYANWVVLDASRSKWSLKSTLKDYLEGATTRRQNYVDLRTKGRAAPVGNIGLSLAHLSRQMGKYGEYCPVNLLDRGELVKGPFDTTFTAEYQNRYYRMSDLDALEAFLHAPERYVSGPDLPESLPERRPMTVLTFPRQLELQGFCPVTYYEGPQGSFGSMVTGRLDMIVEYEQKLYAMVSEEKLEKFMRTPWNYINLELPRKLPPKLAPIPVGTLPLIGYLEQSVARTLSEALCAPITPVPKIGFERALSKDSLSLKEGVI